MKILHVAEKNDAAKNIAAILSNGTHRVREGLSVYNKIYEFTGRFRNVQNAEMKMTSASGHILNFAFPDNYKHWNSVDPVVLFDAPVVQRCESETSEQIKRTLEREVRGCDQLVLWTDCDREGEAIGFEIMEICRAVKPQIKVWRAKFSEITRPSINRALATLAELDEKLNNAVLVRSELDLRIGAAFTRLQTLRVGRRFASTSDKVLSYGSCQFPTLGFVVERYKEIDRFEAERFYKIEVVHEKDGIRAEFNWRRGRIFNHAVCFVLYEKMLERPNLHIQEVSSKPKTKFRPQPMDTVTLEKLASRKLKITAKEALKQAEALYTAGLISYPRTETNIFPPELQLQPLVQAQTESPQWGAMAQKILNDWGGPHPRNGSKSDQAHPPIHPTKYANISLQDNKGKVYELVVRHFLACVSRDARGQETLVEATVDEEHFSLNGLQILERNYLDVYPYEGWSSKEIPIYYENETFTPSGIFTHLVPGLIGMSLVEGYDDMGFEMSKPRLRAALERDLQRICDGTIDHRVVLREQIEAYRRVFINTVQQLHKLNEAFTKFLKERPVEGLPENFGTVSDAMPCPRRCANGRMSLRRSRAGDKWFLSSACCQTIMWMPSAILDGCEISDQRCDNGCGDNTFKIIFKLKQGKHTQLPREYVVCVVCDPDPQMLFNLRFVQGAPPTNQSNNSGRQASTNNNRDSGTVNRAGRGRGAGRRGAAPPGRTRNCGACGRPGHRRTTCPNNRDGTSR
ncbi:DNA topoisomerase 3-alpha-like [Tropilaelaps mercedesae]|uniref:DNA topoisomerase n=1 Tax=Tropilaelaps mercedesae TaxID=418985 RepID=A0A1V9WZU2_9ACAR|nr:DNA topoisomerase 3-alpha-like [Tropilaelaps mercedesae]